jgi:PAS domain S-box-containing protein
MEEGEVRGTGPDQELFLSAFKASPIGIALEDMEGRPLFANPALCSMLGFSEEEMRSRHCVEFSPPEDAEKDWALFEQLVAGSIDHYQLEKRFFRRDGSVIWGRLSISLLERGTSRLVVAMVEDLTEKKTARDELLKSEARDEKLAGRLIQRRRRNVLGLPASFTAIWIA